MSLLDPLPVAVVADCYTHRGWLGACPIWESADTGEIVERNGVPEWWLLLNIWAVSALDAAWRWALVLPEPPDPIVLTGRLDVCPLGIPVV